MCATNGDCSGLTSVTIPNSVTSIGGSAFSGTRLTETIYCADKLVFVPESYKGEFVIPSSVTTIVGGAFYNCSGLTSVTIPTSVTSIGDRAFSSCSGLTSVMIPTSVTSIGDYAFYECSGLTSVTIPNSVTSIGEWAFYTSYSIKEVYWDANLDKSPFFQSTSKITDVVIGDNVTTVYTTFSSCSNIQNITIGKKVTHLRNKAFGNMANVKTVTSYAKEPPYCYPDVFTNVPSTATLKVYKSAVEAYKKAAQWSNFANIEVMPDEDDTTSDIDTDDPSTPTTSTTSTDISTLAKAVYTPSLTIRPGKTFTLPLNVKSEKEEIVGFQFDLMLPKEVTLAKNSRGGIATPAFNEEADRTSTEYHKVGVSEQEDGSYRVLCYSDANELILGTDGTVFDFIATLAEDAEAGEYPVTLSNIVMTNKDLQQYKVEKVVSVISVPSYTIGDANDDGEINVTDIASTASYILGNKPNPFVEQAADVNEDSEINVTDIAGIANLILNGPAKSAAAPRKAGRAASQTSLQIESMTVESGTTSCSVPVVLKNPGEEFTGFQFDLVLPEGFGWAKNSRGKMEAPKFDTEADRTSTEYHKISAAVRDDGSVRVLCYSDANETFLGEDGNIAFLPLIIAADLSEGIYEFVMKDIVISRPNGTDMKISECKFTITVGNPTGISSVGAESENGAMYSINGIRISVPRKGINIIRMSDGATRKVYVK